MTTQYIGARYVPKFYEGSNGTEWEPNVSYEPLTIVTYLGNSYTSKKIVPASIGNPQYNANYWASTGIYSTQVEEYRQEVIEYKKETDNLSDKLDLLISNNALNVKDYGAIGDGVSDDTEAIKNAITQCIELGYKTLYIPIGTYLITDTITLPSSFTQINIVGENADNTIIKADFNGTVFVLIGGSGSMPLSYIANLTFTKTETYKKTGSVVRFENANGRSLFNVKVNNYNIVGECLNTDGFTEFCVLDTCDITSCNYVLYLHRQENSPHYSFHGCGLKNCTIRDTTNHIIYLDGQCFLYNAPIDFTCWENGNNSFIYINAPASSPSYAKNIIAYGNIKFEVENNVNIINSAYEGVLLLNGGIEGIGGNNANLENVVITNSLYMKTNGAVEILRGNSRFTKQLKNGNDVITFSGYRTIRYHIIAPNFEKIGMLNCYAGGGAQYVNDLVVGTYQVVSHNVSFTVSNNVLKFNCTDETEFTVNFDLDYVAI